MGVTAFTFVLLPLSLLWIASPDKLLRLLLVAAVFEAAAALTIGGLGLQPGLVPAFAFLAFTSLQLLLGARYPGQAQVLRITRPFILVTLWAVASSYIMPRLFEGVVYVWPQKSQPPFVLTPLAPNPSNLNQDVYLVVNCALLVMAAMFLTRSGLSLLPFIRAYFYSGFIAAGVAAWQFANRVAGIPYPEDLFYSNPGWAILTSQQIGSVPRINGSFSEPAALATYMASIVYSTGWLLLKGHRDGMVRWLFIVALGTMMLSTSTTGFATLAIAVVGVSVYALMSGSTRTMGMILKIGMPLALLIAVISAGASMFVPDFNKNVEQVIDATLNKQQSSSYADRTSADADSITAAIDSYGLGAGWGSNRSSSLLPGLLAGLGAPGCIGLVWFGAIVARRVAAARKAGCSRNELLVIDGSCGAVVGFLVTAAISAPTLSSVTFFFLLALLIAGTVRVGINARRRSAAARAEKTLAAAAVMAPGAA